MYEIGLSCVEVDQKKRPSAGEILLRMLSGECTHKVDQELQLFSGKNMAGIDAVPSTYSFFNFCNPFPVFELPGYSGLVLYNT